MMKEYYAKQINGVKNIARQISLNYQLDLVEGQMYNNCKKAESWSEPGAEFSIENEKKYVYVFTCDNVPCHAVDYNNKKETYDLGATDCEKEREVLVSADTKMVITYVSSDEDFEEMGYYSVELKLDVD